MSIMQALVIRFGIFIAIVFGCALAGCSQDPVVSAQIKQIQSQSHLKVAQAKSAGDVNLQNAKSKAAVNEVNGKQSPVTHPIAAANELVKDLRTPLLILTIAAFVCWAVEFGLSFTSYTFLSKLGPVFRTVSIVSLVALVVLPFLPIGLFIVILALIGMVSYELIRAKGNLPIAIKETEVDLGFFPYNKSNASQGV